MYLVASYEILYMYKVLLLIFTNCRIFNKGAVVSGRAYFPNFDTIIC